MEATMDVRTIGVVGCGLMGTGIIEVAAQAGLRVIAVKATTGSIDGVATRIKTSLDRAVSKGKLTTEARDAILARIEVTSDLDHLVECDLVVESTAETLSNKKRMLPEIEQAMRPGAILATNTSSLPLAQLAETLTR